MADDRQASFTIEGAKRIVDTVRRVEDIPRNRLAPAASGPGAQGFWVKILAAARRIPGAVGTPDQIITVYDGSISDITGDPIFYDWIMLTAAPNGFMLPVQPNVTGSASARRINDSVGATSVPYGTTVRLFPAGLDSMGDAIFEFCYDAPLDPMVVAPHDHRSNFPGYGGFAFSVYHPGTSLPQLPWAI